MFAFSSPPTLDYDEHSFPQDFHDPQYRSIFVNSHPGISEPRWWLGEPVSRLLDMLKCADGRALTPTSLIVCRFV